MSMFNADEGVSDLEKYMDHFALPGRSFENLEFLFCRSNSLAIRTEKPV